jgi:hypothetical protein
MPFDEGKNSRERYSHGPNPSTPTLESLSRKLCTLMENQVENLQRELESVARGVRAAACQPAMNLVDFDREDQMKMRHEPRVRSN